MMTNEKWRSAQGNMDAIHKQWAEVWQRERAAMCRWAQAHGSAHLRTAIAHGYEPISLYLKERLAQEWPGWRFYRHVPKDPIEYPTEATLEIEKQVLERMEATDWPMSSETFLTRDDKEIIIVQGYLGQWEICRIID